MTWGDPNQGGDSSRPARNVGFGDGKPDFFGGNPGKTWGSIRVIRGSSFNGMFVLIPDDLRILGCLLAIRVSYGGLHAFGCFSWDNWMTWFI